MVAIRGRNCVPPSTTTKLPVCSTVMTVFLYSEGDLHSERDVGLSTLGNRGEGMDHHLPLAVALTWNFPDL